ncbi:GNAT family N-acetyltransferase [Peribacillus muralis]|uniref:GNAT family N-acetyltransferase n=1 Tax=Peribacillus muralis TaxID=264697 RepID=UPI001F4DC0C9|nr:GNAT family N-acetyltransferase [Peribacillus muralis]MCK1992103.1 GNAT family N-acetyltransferase [Peribacillus muralis]MCK2012659.1 GNAT family N-acetyltransferase [Peribacillus muralis]
MQELDEGEFEKLVPSLYKSVDPIPTFAFAVLEQFMPGFVFVDESHSPKTIGVGTNSGLYFVGGDHENDEFNKQFLRFCRSKLKEGKRFTLFSGNGKWDELISGCFKEELKQGSRYSFSFQPEGYDVEAIHLQESYTLSRLDEATIRNSSEFNINYYERFWGSAVDFLDKGFGYSVVHDETVVASECTSIFRGKVYAEIDIYTKADYRGMGLAQKAAQAFIEQCLKHKMLPRWDCNVENLASMKLAGRLGFSEPSIYSIFVKNRQP